MTQQDWEDFYLASDEDTVLAFLKVDSSPASCWDERINGSSKAGGEDETSPNGHAQQEAVSPEPSLVPNGLNGDVETEETVTEETHFILDGVKYEDEEDVKNQIETKKEEIMRDVSESPAVESDAAPSDSHDEDEAAAGDAEDEEEDE